MNRYLEVIKKYRLAVCIGLVIVVLLPLFTDKGSFSDAVTRRLNYMTTYKQTSGSGQTIEMARYKNNVFSSSKP